MQTKVKIYSVYHKPTHNIVASSNDPELLISWIKRQNKPHQEFHIESEFPDGNGFQLVTKHPVPYPECVEYQCEDHPWVN